MAPRTTCYNRFNRWRQAGVWDRLMDAISAAHDGEHFHLGAPAGCDGKKGGPDHCLGRSRGGLVPKQASTGGKQKLGAISKMGERTLRRLLIIGSSAVVLQASKRGAPAGSWLEGMLARKPRMLVSVRAKASPHPEMRPLRSISPDW